MNASLNLSRMNDAACGCCQVYERTVELFLIFFAIFLQTSLLIVAYAKSKNNLKWNFWNLLTLKYLLAVTSTKSKKVS